MRVQHGMLKLDTWQCMLMLPLSNWVLARQRQTQAKCESRETHSTDLEGFCYVNITARIKVRGFPFLVSGLVADLRVIFLLHYSTGDPCYCLWP